jgi:hypothetical protein
VPVVGRARNSSIVPHSLHGVVTRDDGGGLTPSERVSFEGLLRDLKNRMFIERFLQHSDDEDPSLSLTAAAATGGGGVRTAARRVHTSLFWTACDKFRVAVHDTQAALKDSAGRIFAMYLGDLSPLRYGFPCVFSLYALSLSPSAWT